MGLCQSIRLQSQDVDAEENNINRRYRCLPKSRPTTKPCSVPAITHGAQYEQLSGCPSLVDGQCATDSTQSPMKPVSAASDSETSSCCMCCNIRVRKKRHKRNGHSKKVCLIPVHQQPVHLPSNESSFSSKLLAITGPEVTVGPSTCDLVKSLPDQNREVPLHPFPSYCRVDGEIELLDVDFSHEAVESDFVIYSESTENGFDISMPCISKTEIVKRSGLSNSFVGFSLFSRAFSRKSDVVEDYTDVEARLLDDGEELTETGFMNSTTAAVSDGLSLNGSAQNDFDGINLSYCSAPIARFDSTLSEASDVCDDSLEGHHNNSMSESFMLPVINEQQCLSMNIDDVDGLKLSSAQNSRPLNMNKVMNGYATFDASLSCCTDDSMSPSTNVQLIEDDAFIMSLLDDVNDCRSLLVSLGEILKQDAGDGVEMNDQAENFLQSAVLEDNLACRSKIAELQNLIGEQQDTIDQLRQRLNVSAQKCSINDISDDDSEEHSMD